MMNYLWGGMFCFSVVCACINGRMEDVTRAIIESAGTAVTMFMGLFGVMVLWGGLMSAAQRAGITDFVGRLLYPILHRLFPRLSKDGDELPAISMNITANLFGLGNAATPLGIEAMNKLQLINSDKIAASDEMIMLVVLNSASLHLIPTTVAMLRSSAGSASPMEILLPGLLSSAVALTVGIIAAKLYGVHKRSGRI